MNKQEVIAKLIEQLKLALTRPALFMGETTVRATQIYTNGILTALVAMGIVLSLDIRREAAKSRGWECGPTGGVDNMQAGLTEEQIVQELLMIEIKMLELVAEGLED